MNPRHLNLNFHLKIIIPSFCFLILSPYFLNGFYQLTNYNATYVTAYFNIIYFQESKLIEIFYLLTLNTF
jgi:hypothetical protein